MSSHAACDHPATKAARAQCRRMRDAGMRGARNSRRAQQLEPERPESSIQSLSVEHVKLSKGKLFAGIWVRLRASRDDEWQCGYLLSAANDNVRVVLDSGERIEFRWESGAYEMEQEIYRLEGDGDNRRTRHARYNRR